MHWNTVCAASNLVFTVRSHYSGKVRIFCKHSGPVPWPVRRFSNRFVCIASQFMTTISTGRKVRAASLLFLLVKTPDVCNIPFKKSNVLESATHLTWQGIQWRTKSVGRRVFHERTNPSLCCECGVSLWRLLQRSQCGDVIARRVEN